MDIMELYGLKMYDSYTFSEGRHLYRWFLRTQDQHPCHYHSILYITKNESKNSIVIDQQIEGCTLSKGIYYSEIYQNTQNIGECLTHFLKKYGINEEYIYDNPIKEPAM